MAYGGAYAQAAGLKVIQDCLAFLQPQLLRLFLAYISSYHKSANSDPAEGFTIVAVMFIASMAQTVILHQASLFAAFVSTVR